MCIGIVNKVESTLARSVLCGVFVNAGREISVASTKAFSGQVVALLLTTLFFSQTKNESKNVFFKFDYWCKNQNPNKYYFNLNF